MGTGAGSAGGGGKLGEPVLSKDEESASPGEDLILVFWHRPVTHRHPGNVGREVVGFVFARV